MVCTDYVHNATKSKTVKCKGVKDSVGEIVRQSPYIG